RAKIHETAKLVQERVDHALPLIAEQPRIGTPTATPGVRRYPIARAGHVITYRLVKGQVRVLRWFRARQNEPFRS
ncbi:MAG: type II toxin-antitoxin system RelE/ParE family toxin, partial [Betaproteobacteria bacterium]|nr:type II toxin-antitoxin system RelE/ParE family toxin [Betaproteobacteria bacterium]